MTIASDLKLVGELDSEILNQGFALIASTAKGVDRSIRLKSFAEETNEEAVKGLYRLVMFAAEQLVEARDFNKGIEDLDARLRAFAEGDEVAILGWERIKELVLGDVNFLVSEKTEHMKNRYSRVLSFQITSDIRPVFDIERTEVRDFLYPHILKIETADDQEFLCEVYDDELDDLIVELELAKEKCVKLRKHVELAGSREG